MHNRGFYPFYYGTHGSIFKTCDNVTTITYTALGTQNTRVYNFFDTNISKNPNIPLTCHFVLFIWHHTKVLLLDVQVVPLDRF